MSTPTADTGPTGADREFTGTNPTLLGLVLAVLTFLTFLSFLIICFLRSCCCFLKSSSSTCAFCFKTPSPRGDTVYISFGATMV